MAAEFADRIEAGISEYYSLILFALAGMMFASSANDFTMLFVSLELITVTFYVLTSFQRGRVQSLEAGVKYLVIGGLSTGFTVFGIALVSGSVRPLANAAMGTNTMNFGVHRRVREIPGRARRELTDSHRGTAARAGGTRFQNRRGAVSDLGAGCLSRLARADDCVPRGRFQGRGFRSSAARAFHGRARHRPALGKIPDGAGGASRFFTATCAPFRNATSSVCSATPASPTPAIC